MQVCRAVDASRAVYGRDASRAVHYGQDTIRADASKQGCMVRMQAGLYTTNYRTSLHTVSSMALLKLWTASKFESSLQVEHTLNHSLHSFILYRVSN